MVLPAVQLTYTQGVEHLSQALLRKTERVLLFGPTGAGKSYLAAELARRLQLEKQSCVCLSADPGSPRFGIPAAINFGAWNHSRWQLKDFEALCSLDAARFRLPLAEAVSRLLLRVSIQQPLIIDAPGMTRGVAASELLTTLVNLTATTMLVVLDSQDESITLEPEIASLHLPVIWMSVSDEAHAPSRFERLAWRTQLWEQYMKGAEDTILPLEEIALLGTPPPLEFPEKWCGRVISLSDADGVITMGEVLKLQEQKLRLRCHQFKRSPSQLLLRDAWHLPGQKLVTVNQRKKIKPVATTFSGSSLVYPSDHKETTCSTQICRRDITAELVNGLFEDPLLLIKTSWSRRCLLFDLGNTSRLPMRHIHNVSHIFITHAHFDHIGGFMGLLRVRLGAPTSCTLYGPPGLAQHIAGMLRGILWDRIGDNGPEFDVAELHGELLRCFHLKAGQDAMTALPAKAVKNGIIHQEERFRVRAVELDHGTPVLAYAYEPVAAIGVSEKALSELQLPPGRWLGKLKYTYMAGEHASLIELPNGDSKTVGELASRLLRKQAGKKLVYATDLADTAENREKLITLAHHADTLICEAAFSRDDHFRGINNGHLTTTACGEIAAAADVEQLMPFHFSRRYEGDPEKLFREIEEIFPRIVRIF
ncbi:MBL fold metallo-hydrolase [Photobacterium sp. SDRW27]|uniref:MBL fold metallo-hydrolase n=1 Tax=Photobacterium obscurum TaxID=2829490 RepID=UPI002242C83D|nr:MBL fold metallo-hydrolase [Photobacterium obscurum]MCW8329068.1 MBL fold metallo-hydrolase [Photobacterium obscurum]